MGIVSRFSDIMKSNINALLDKCEDPAKMIDQTLRDLREDLAEVKKDTAGVMADAKRSQEQVDKCKADIDRYQNAAMNAIKAGNDSDAKKLLSKKQAFEQSLVSLEQTNQVNQDNAAKMRQMHDKLVSDIESLEARKDAIKAKVSTAKAQERINKMTAGVNTSASISAFERMEAKADKMLHQAQAEAELNAGSESADDLADKYVGGASGDSVDDELAKLKQQMGIQ